MLRLLRSDLQRGLLIAGLVLPMGQSAYADEQDTVNFTLGTNFLYNSNVFRTPDTSGPQAGFTTKADIITNNNAGVTIAKSYSQQRFQLDSNYSMRQYDTFSRLDANTLNYHGAWLWALTPHVTGSFNLTQNQAEIPFTDTTGETTRNTRTSTSRTMSLDGWISGKWHVIAGLGQTESKTEQAILSTPATKSQYMEAGLRYVATSQNSITLRHRVTPVELTNFTLDPNSLTETNYKDIETEIKVSWKLSGQSTIDGRLARKSRRNEHFAQRDFSGISGNLNYAWKPTAKLQFTFGASRNVSAFGAVGNATQNSSFRLDQTLTVGAAWSTSARTSMNLSLSRQQSDFLGPVFGNTSAARVDELTNAQLGMSWGVRRYVTLSASVGRDFRASNAAGFQFSNNSASLGAQLNF